MSEQTSRSLLHLCAVALRLYNRESNTACLFQTVFQCLRVHRIRAIPDSVPVFGLLDQKPAFRVLVHSNECPDLCSISDFPWSGIWYRPRRVPGNAHRLCGSFLRTHGRSASQRRSSIRRYPFTSLISTLAPNSTSAFCFPRTTGRTQG